MAASAFEMPNDKRDSRRARLLLTAHIADGLGEREAHLLNISPTGAKVDADEPPASGAPVTLIAGGLRIAGRVAWVEDNRFGIAFDTPIDARALLARGQQHLAG